MRDDHTPVTLLLILAVLSVALYELGRLDGAEDERMRHRCWERVVEREIAQGRADEARAKETMGR